MITNNYSPAWPASDSAADVAATAAYDTLQNRVFTDPVLLGRYPDLTRVRRRRRRPGLRAGRRPGRDLGARSTASA